VQASELQEINKLIKEAERLCAMAVGDAEDCGSEDNSRSTKGAAVNRICSSLSKSRTSPSTSTFGLTHRLFLFVMLMFKMQFL